MLRSPPVAVMCYYTNLFLSARFVLGDQPERIRHLDKEIKRVECMVGVRRKPDSDRLQRELIEFGWLRKGLEKEMQGLEAIYENTPEEMHPKIEAMFQEISEQMQIIEIREFQLLNQLEPLMNLKMVETYMDNNFDLKSFFKEHGNRVTQMELNAELEKIKIWVYQEAVEMMPYIRFTKLE